MRDFRRALLIVLAASLLSAPTARADNSMREFVMSCTYGVLAGTLVGAALLAFTSQPGENMQKVARGASLGLYAGILLGAYVVYIVPGAESEQDLLNGPTPSGSWHWKKREIRAASVALIPTFDANFKIDGAGVAGEVLRF